MESTHIIGKDGTPVIVTGGNGYDGYGRKDDCVEELIVQNTIHSGTISNLNATHRNTADVLSAVAQSTRDSMEASNRNGIAGIKETSDVGRDNIRETARGASENLRETARVGADLSKDVSDIRASIERTNGESRLATTITSGETRELINTVGSANLLAIKDNLSAIKEEGCKTREAVYTDGCKTREQEAEHFAKLQYQAEKNKNDIEKEMLKGFHVTQLEAQKNACDLAAKLAECCCELKQQHAGTRALVLSESTKELERKLAKAELAAAIAGISGKPGQGNN